MGTRITRIEQSKPDWRRKANKRCYKMGTRMTLIEQIKTDG
jgi:hypothetical protein